MTLLRVVTLAVALLHATTTAAQPAGDGREPAAAVQAPATPAAVAEADSARLVDYLWVLRTSLVDPAEIPRVVARAREMGVRGLLVQVVGRGDAWYTSDLLPPPEAIADTTRDPLGELLPLAQAAGLEVHAWVNACLVWSGPRPPRDRRHVLHAHPEWIARMADGRPMSVLTPARRERLAVEGVFLAPGHPAVRTHVARIARELAGRYPLDGIHLDYIRQPSIPVGYDPTTRARFALAHGADPLAFGRLAPAARAEMERAWDGFQRDQVTALVREVRDSIAATRPGIPLSAAVLADTLSAVTRNRQPWPQWLRDGLLDRAFAMCYATPVQTVMDQLLAMSGRIGRDRLVPGIAIYNTPPAAAAAKIKGARTLGYPAVALYSYDSLYEKTDLWSRLRQLLVPASALEVSP
jgi:uncharacterized lipoprotein YddW (UPF0748 family)